MTTKRLRLVDAIKADAATLQPRHKNWFDRLSREDRDEIAQIKADWKAGLISMSCSSLAKAIVQRCGEYGIPVCGHQGVRMWLSKD